MMQIFDNAIECSKIGKPQYVLQKSLDYVLCEYGESLLEHLLDDWNIVGEFINGTGYEHYVLTEEKAIWIIKNMLNIESENINAVVIGITIYFDDLHRIEKKKADVVSLNDGHKVDEIDIKDKAVDNLRDTLIFNLSAKQHKSGIITKLKIDLQKQKAGGK